MPVTGRARRVALIFALLVAAAVAVLLSRSPHRGGHRDPRFYTLGELATELAGDPKLFDAVLDRLGAGRTAVGLVPATEALVLRRMFQAADYRGLDRHPRVSLAELQLAVAALAAHANRNGHANAVAAAPADQPLGIPTGAAPPTGEPYLSELGFGLRHGDRIDPEQALRFPDAERLAFLLDRLALGSGDPAQPFSVELDGDRVTTPEALVAQLVRTGHTAEVLDQRFLANFGDLEKDGTAVATPLWVLTGIGRGDAELAVPVPHIQVTLVVRGARVNADASLYNSLDFTGGSDGGTRFRAEVTRDQPWVGGRVAHRYQGRDAIEAVRWMGLLRRATDEKVRALRLPLDGYLALGVCTLAPAVVEQAILGRTSIWPLTQDPALFPSESAIDRLVRALPTDGRGVPSDPERVFASLPWTRLAEVPFPELATALASAGFR